MKREIALYLALSLVPALYLSTNKYLFLLDSVPKLNINSFLSHFYGFSPPVYGSFLFPSFLPQQLLVFLCLFLSCVSMHRLLSLFNLPKFSVIYASLLYAFNPYTYIRIVVGHFGILLSYSVLPLAVKHFIEMKDLRSSIKCALTASIVAVNSHTLLIFFIVAAVLTVFLRKNPLYFLVSFFLINVYWIVPAMSQESLISSISEEDLVVFAFKGNFLDLASMHGFWREAYSYAKDVFPLSFALFFPILFFSINALVENRKNTYVLSFAAILVLGFFLAASVRSFLSPLFSSIPLLRGMRDAHKFVAMLCLSYSFLGAFGTAKFKRYSAVIPIIPLLYSFSFFTGFNTEIKPCDFPEDWYEVKKLIESDKEDFKVLFLPWHLYMDFKWVCNKDKRIANPAPSFFSKDVISGKNIEIGSIYSQIHSPYQEYMASILKNKDCIRDFGRLVSFMGVKYIVLAKEADYANYLFLFNQSDLELVKETENLLVFKNLEFKGIVFSVDSLENPRVFKKLKYKKVSPVEYIIEDEPLNYIVVAEEYSDAWRMDGEKPLKAFNASLAFPVKSYSKEFKVVYTRFFSLCIPCYIASLLSFITFLLLPRLIRKVKTLNSKTA